MCVCYPGPDIRPEAARSSSLCDQSGPADVLCWAVDRTRRFDDRRVCCCGGFRREQFFSQLGQSLLYGETATMLVSKTEDCAVELHLDTDDGG